MIIVGPSISSSVLNSVIFTFVVWYIDIVEISKNMTFNRGFDLGLHRKVRASASPCGVVTASVRCRLSEMQSPFLPLNEAPEMSMSNWFVSIVALISSKGKT